MDDVDWLNGGERATWLAFVAMTTLVPPTIDAQLQRDAGLGFFEYTVLSMLSEQPDRTLRMSDLAEVANGSLSRLSHVAKRLESRGLLRRSQLPEDGRITVATLTGGGHDLVVRAAPGHVRNVRMHVIDALDPEQRRCFTRACLALLASTAPGVHAMVSAEMDSTGEITDAELER